MRTKMTAMAPQTRRHRGRAGPDPADRKLEFEPTFKRPFLVLVTGVACSRKSLVSKGVLELAHAVYLDKDCLADAVDPHSRRSDKYLKARDCIYDALWRVVDANLKIGNSVVVDAPLVKELADPEQCNEIVARARAHNAELVVIRCICDLDHLRERMESRGLKRDEWKLENWSEWTNEEPMDAPVHISEGLLVRDTDEGIDNIVQGCLHEMEAGSGTLSRRRAKYSELAKWMSEHHTACFNERRKYEWAMCLGVWGAFGATALAIFDQDFPVGILPVSCLAVLGALFVAIHYWWIVHLLRRNFEDRYAAHVWRIETLRSANVFVPPHLVATDVENLESNTSVFEDWNHRVQVYLSAALWLAVVFALVARSLAPVLNAVHGAMLSLM